MNKKLSVTLLLLVGLVAVCAIGTGAVNAQYYGHHHHNHPVVNNSTIPPVTNTTKVPPVVNNSTVPPVVNTTKVPPVVNNSTVPPVTNTTKVPPVVNNSTVPPVVNTTKVPPVVNNSTVPPVVNTTPVFPTGVTIISTVAGLTTALNNAVSGSTIYLSSGVFNINGLTISKNIILQGAGQNLTIFEGNGKSILSVGNVQATINNIQFVDGAASYGGALTNGGTLTLNRDTFTGNTASEYGGAINNNKILNVNNCLFTNNTTPGVFEIGYGSGSAILNNAGCTLPVTKSTFSGNTAGSYAAIFQLGSSTITNVILLTIPLEKEQHYIHLVLASSQVKTVHSQITKQ